MQYVRNKALFDPLSFAAENEDKAQMEELSEEDMPESEDTNFSASGHHLRQHLNTGCTISSAADPEITAVSESGYHQLQQKDANMIPTEQEHWAFRYSSHDATASTVSDYQQQ